MATPVGLSGWFSQSEYIRIEPDKILGLSLSMATQITNLKSICILRLSAIGDVCHAVASVQSIQRKHPQAKITWIIGKVEAVLLQNLPDVEFVIFDKKAGLKGYRDLCSHLKGRKFDILLHMQVAIRASLATLCVSATERWGFDKTRAKEGQWLFTNHKIAPQKEPHVADGFWGFAQAIGSALEPKPSWQMPVSPQDQLWCEQQVGNESYIVISPAASKLERNWLPNRYAMIADYAYAQGFQIILSGGPTVMEKQLGEKIINASNAPIINLIGKTNLPQLLALIENAKLVLAPDSGPAHMATTVNTPVIGLYAHSNPIRTGPYHSLDTTVSVYEKILEQQTGKTVQDNPWGKRVKGDDLMAQISVESVIRMFDRIIKKS